MVCCSGKQVEGEGWRGGGWGGEKDMGAERRGVCGGLVGWGVGGGARERGRVGLCANNYLYR